MLQNMQLPKITEMDGTLLNILVKRRSAVLVWRSGFGPNINLLCRFPLIPVEKPQRSKKTEVARMAVVEGWRVVLVVLRWGGEAGRAHH